MNYTLIGSETLRPIVEQLLHEMIDDKVFQEIIDNIEIGRIYFINSQDLLELPVIEVKKLEDQKDDYEEHRKLLEELARQKEEEDEMKRQRERELREKARQEILKQMERQHFPENKGHPLKTRKQLIQEQNDYYDSFFKKQDDDNYRYDIIIPVKDIQQTTGNVQDYYARKVLNPNEREIHLNFQDQKQNYLDYNQKNKQQIDEIQTKNPNKSWYQGEKSLNFIQSVQEKEQAEKIENKRQQELENKSKIQKNVYYYKPKVEIHYSEESERENSPFQAPKFQLEYKKEGEILKIKNPYDYRIQKMENINSRIQSSVIETDLKKSVLNIPLVIQANADGYQGYKYEEKNEDQVGNLRVKKEIFLDYDEIRKEDAKILDEKKRREEAYRKYLQQLEEEEERKRKEEEQNRINYFMMPQHERYLKKMLQFIEHDEDPGLTERLKNKKQPGTFRANKKQKQKQDKQGGLQIENSQVYPDQGQVILTRDQLIQLKEPVSDMVSATLNLKSPDWAVVFNTLTQLRSITRYNFEIFFGPEIKLSSLLEDIIRAGDHQINSVCLNALLCMSEMEESLKEAMNTNINQLITVCLRRSLDKHELIQDYARQALVNAGKYTDTTRIINVLKSNYDSRINELKISIGLILEQLVQRVTVNYQNQEDLIFQDIIYFISEFVNDKLWEVRRLGKKVLFKLLSSDINQELFKDQIKYKLDNLDQDLFLKYIEKYNDLFKDDKELKQYREPITIDPNQNYIQEQDMSIYEKILPQMHNLNRQKRPNSHMLKKY
ncbi:Armadillo-type fold [Pseudocohnilembus persalinus]|uniref:Armadillo-type fold n=1 Tax=Pseudocohnilembus persalinus TaxID=266149 RepID=A0A0V0QBF1_PSEPJ|nr:Armadillo-type fold [Pseudocohnilembus persalinus]|eukprot:KRW99528.1 Armadillo-type fold [Pseudocohnilembus persalinus]